MRASSSRPACLRTACSRWGYLSVPHHLSLLFLFPWCWLGYHFRVCLRCHTSLRKWCFRHCSAVARSLGSYANMGRRKSVNSWATCGSHSYFSVSTSNRPHGFNFVMCRSSPDRKRKLEWTCKRQKHQCNGQFCGTSFVEKLSGVLPRECYMPGNIANKLNDVCQVIFVPWVVLSWVRFKQVVACGHLKSHASCWPDVSRCTITGTKEDL